MTHYTTLDLPIDATQDEIKKAYRSKAQKHHPDKNGDKEAFQAIQKAYDVLSDPDTRAYCDEHGSEPQQGPTLKDEAMALLVQAIDQVIQQTDVDFENVLENAKDLISQKSKATQEEIDKMEKMLQKAAKAAKRTKAKDGQPDMLADILQHLQTRFTMPLQQARRMIEVCTHGVAILEGHSYETDTKAPATHDELIQAMLSSRMRTMFGGAA